MVTKGRFLGKMFGRNVFCPLSLHKIQDDGDDIYLLEDSGEFVVLSYDGYIRTYFKPKKALEYFNRQ